MSDVTIEPGARPERDELVALYDAVGWTAYTDDPDGLAGAVRDSSFVVTARDAGRLVGLARCLSDGVAIAYLQDILVHPDARRRGVGTRLMEACRERYADVRAFVLLTDDRPDQLAFYEAHGFTNVAATAKPALNAFVRMRGVTFDHSSK
jgi:GNAT superfamily N-acetyltransferase